MEAYRKGITYLNQGHSLHGKVPSADDVVLYMRNVTITRPEAVDVFNYLANNKVGDGGDYVGRLKDIFPDLGECREQISLLSMLYNAGEGIFGSDMRRIVNDSGDNLAQHAMLWAEIRYDSNGDRDERDISNGIQNRRNAESDYIGIFSNGSSDPAQVATDEVKAVADFLFKGRNGDAIIQDGVEQNGFFRDDNWTFYADDYNTYVSKVVEFLSVRYAWGESIDWVSSDQRLGNNAVLDRRNGQYGIARQRRPDVRLGRQ